MIRLLFSCCLLLALSAAQLAAQSPSTATINAGGSYTFTAGTTTPAAQYQWLKNGVPIPNATGASFTIAAGTPRDGGTYSVTIATAGGATTGPATRLTVSSGYLTTTLAGKAGVSGRADGPGDVARFSTPSGLGVDAAGNFYVADSANSRLCRITPNGIVSTLATPLTLRDPAVPSFSSRPEGLALDAAGNVYFADGNAIRRLAPDGTVTTVAGTPNTSGSTNGPAATALFQNPTGVAVDAQGNIFVSDYTQRIRKISPAREVTTVAGTGQIGAADGPGLSARFNNPQGIAVDAAGTIYVADYNNNCVRKIAPDGTVSTLAGVPGSQGSVDGPATTARFQFPRFVAIDRSGQVFVADDSHTIRRISPAGVVTTIAGSSFATGTTDGIGAVARFNQPRGLAVDAGGTLAIVDGANSTVRLARLDSEPVPATTIAQQPVAFDAVVALPMSLSVTPAGAPPFTYQWLKDGAMVAGATAASLRLDSTRTADAGTYTVIVTGEGGATTSDPAVVTVRTGTQAPAIVGQSRGLVTATAGEETILYLSASGYPTPSVQWYRDGTVIAGATNSFFPLSRAQVSDAGVYTAQASNAVGQLTGESATVVVNPKVTRTYITPADGVVAVGGTVSFALEATLGGATATYQWLKNGVPLPGQNGPTLTLNPVQGRDSAIYSVTVGNGSGAATSAAMVLGVQSGYTVSTFASRAGNFGGTTGTGVAANFFYPEGLVLDRDGNVYVADLNNDVVWKITPAGIITAFAGAALQNGSVDGAGAAARFFHPKSLAIDAAGALYVVETYNATVRKITPGGVVTTLAGKALATGRTDGPAADARFGDLRAVAVSPTGDVYVIDGTSLRKIATNGTVSTVLPPSPADPAQRLSNPNGLAVDRAGNVYIADTGNYVVRRLTPAGVLSVVAGQIGASGTTDGAVATARLSGPRALAVDDAGNLFIGDGRVLRRLGTDGMVITLAGGSSGWANGTGTGARFSSIYAIAVDPAGRLYLMDGANDAVRVATPPTYALFLPTMITKQPATASPTAGGTASLSVTADGTGPFTYQWLRDGTVVPGATAATLTLASAQSGDSGTYTVVVTGAGGAVTSTAATLTIQTPIRITNLAIRAGAGSGDATLITGFVVAGGAKPILVRGVGPALTSYGVVGVLPNPRLGLYSGETLLAQNDNWSDDPDATTVAQTTSRLSFALAPNSLDAAMLKTLSDGAYTAQVGSADGRNGIALLEMYDTGSAGPNQGRLVNVSARTSVGTGENILIAGFTITGFPSSLRTTLLIRGVGPALRGYGVEGTLADPQIALFANSTLIQQNDDWGQNGSQITTTSAQVGAFPLPVGSKDAAMVVTLGPGSYTVQLSGVASTTGVGLIEIYEVR